VNGTVAIGSCTGTDHQLLWGTIFAHCIAVGLPIAAAARYVLGSGAKATM
jgi:hypothetical protein